MAQAATELVHEPAAAHMPSRSGPAPEGAGVIPLDLAPLLTPYKKRGRLMIRVEQMPLQARLSAGRNNGDNTWSLAPDELEDLTYLPGTKVDEAHTLAIRIILHDSAGASTAAVLDYAISGDGTGAGPAIPPVESASADPGALAQLGQLRSELAQMEKRLAEREAELAAARDDASYARTELSAAREAWQAEHDAQLAAEKQRAEADLARSRATWQKELETQIAAAEERAARHVTEAREQWKSKANSALAKAEQERARDDAKRLAEAKAQWQKDSDAKLAEVRAAADQTRSTTDAAMQRLQGELEDARKALTTRDGELTHIRANIAKSEAATEVALREAIATAEASWKTGEAQRLTDAKAQWQKETEAKLAEAQTAASRDRNAADEARQGLQRELEDARKALTTRDSELTQLRANMAKAEAATEVALREAIAKVEESAKTGEAQRLAEAKAQWQKDSDAALTDLRTAQAKTESDAQQALRDALAKAEDGWKAGEAARLAEARTQWQKEADHALADVRAAADAGRAATESTIRRLRDEQAELHETLASRDNELTRLRARMAAADGADEQALREAIAKAEDSWKAGEAQRLTEAKAQWQKDSEAALADAQAAAGSDRSTAEGEQFRLRDELRELRATLTVRDGELTQLRAEMVKATEEHKAGEATRLAEAEAKWRAQSEQALAEARKAHDTTGSEQQAETGRLREEIASLTQRLTERDQELAQLREARSQSDARGDQESHEAIAKAEEATRLAEAEAKWKEQSAQKIAELEARCEQAEAAHQTESASAAADKAELKRLRDEWTELMDMLGERDEELEQWRMAASQAETPDETLVPYESKHLQVELAEATKRYEAAEAALADMRNRLGSQAARDLAQLREENTAMQAMLDSREAEVARLRAVADRWREEQEKEAEETARRSKRRKAKASDDDEEQGGGSIIRDVLLVVGVVMAAYMFYPRIVSSLPYEWQEQLPAFMTAYQYSGDDATPTQTQAPTSPKTAPAPAQNGAVVTRGVNLRAGPSTDTKSVTTLPAGTDVVEIERHANWVHVQTVATGKDKPRDGWVYKTYLSTKPASPKP